MPRAAKFIEHLEVVSQETLYDLLRSERLQVVILCDAESLTELREDHGGVVYEFERGQLAFFVCCSTVLIIPVILSDCLLLKLVVGELDSWQTHHGRERPLDADQNIQDDVELSSLDPDEFASFAHI